MLKQRSLTCGAVTTILLATMVAVLSHLAVAGPPDGKGGGKGGGGNGGSTPPGTIYVYSGGVPITMDADGNNVELSPVLGQPTHQSHGGHIWHATLQDAAGTYPNGDPRSKLVAVRDDGEVVELLADVDWQPLQTQPSNPPRGIQWAKDGEMVDGKISFGARQFSNGVLVEQGIYQALVFYGGTGEVAGIGTPELLVPLSDTFNGNLDTMSHSWSPDGTGMAFNLRDSLNLYIYDDITGAVIYIADSAKYPSWSPDGTRIAILTNAGLETISPDGSDALLLVPTVNKGNSVTAAHDAAWLPASAHLVYTEYKFNMKNWSGSEDVVRITSTGADATKLTGDGVSAVIIAR